jgi:hypothetical protein
MLWAMPVLALARHMPHLIWQRLVSLALGVLYTLAIIIPPTTFISCELDFYDEASRIVRGMATLSREAHTGQTSLFVNVPVFFSSYTEHPQGCPNPYPWTPVGAVVMPDYASARDFVRFNGGDDSLASAVSVAAYMPGWKTFGDELGPAELRERLHVDSIYVFDLNQGDFFDLSASWLPGGAGDTEPLALFGTGMRLNSAAVERGEENRVVTSLAWQHDAAQSENAVPKVFVHIYDASGQLIAQHDGPPAGGYVPLDWWGEQDAVIDRHEIELPEGLQAGEYSIVVGVYDSLTGERYTAVPAGESPLADSALTVGQIMLP